MSCELPTSFSAQAAYSSCSGQEQRGRTIRAQKEKQGKDTLGLGDKGGCVVREAGTFGCICPGLTLWFLSSLEEGERSHQTVPLPQTGFGQRQKVWCDARGSPIAPQTICLFPLAHMQMLC